MKENWVVFRKRYIPAVLPIIFYFSWPYDKFLGIEAGTFVNVWKKGDYFVVRDKEMIRQIAEKMLNKLFDNINYLDEIRKEGIIAGEAVVTYAKKFTKNLEKAEIKDYIEFLEKLEKLYNKFIEKNMLYWLHTGEMLEQKITNKLSKYSFEEQQKIFRIMSLPKIKSYSQIEEEEFEEIVNLARKKGIESQKGNIKEFSRKYFWFPYEYAGPEIWDEKAVTKRVKNSLLKPTKTKKLISIEEKQKECIKEFNLPKELVDLFKVLQTIMIMQDDRKMFNAQCCYYLNHVILGSLAKKLGTTLELSRYIEPSLLKNLPKDVHKVLKERENLLAISRDEKGEQIYVGKDAQNYLKEQGIESENKTKPISEIKGQIANKGFVKAKVRILKTSSNIKDFNEGDILVTGMTTPDFVPIIKKCSGIITDEGGIISHAAIVSRELHKPCIIGTKTATEILKDGDVVELDANKGVVKILKRK